MADKKRSRILEEAAEYEEFGDYFPIVPMARPVEDPADYGYAERMTEHYAYKQPEPSPPFSSHGWKEGAQLPAAGRAVKGFISKAAEHERRQRQGPWFKKEEKQEQSEQVEKAPETRYHQMAKKGWLSEVMREDRSIQDPNYESNIEFLKTVSRAPGGGAAVLAFFKQNPHLRPENYGVNLESVDATPEQSRRYQAISAIGRTQFSDIPEYLRPGAAFYHPNYPELLKEAIAQGRIDKRHTPKLMAAYHKFMRTGPGQLVEAKRLQDQATMAKAQAERGIVDLQSDELEDEAKLWEHYGDRVGRLREEHEGYRDELREQYSQQLAAVKQAMFDARRVRKPSKNWLEKLLAGIAVALGGLGASMGRTPNFALQALMKNVDAEMEQYDLELKHARGMVMSEANVLAQMQVQLRTHDQAYAATRVMLLDETKAAIKAHAANTDSKIVRARADAVIAGIDAQIKIENKKIQGNAIVQADELAKRRLMGIRSARLSATKNQREQEMIAQQLGGGNWIPSEYYKDFTAITPHLGTTLKVSPATAEKMRGEIDQFDQLSTDFRRLMQLAMDPNVFVPGSHAYWEYKALKQSGTAERLHDLYGARFTPPEMRRAERDLPADPLSLKAMTGDLRHSVERAIRSADESKSRYYDTHGLVPYKRAFVPSKKGEGLTERYFIGAKPQEEQRIDFQ